jgi:hypothetical protein
VYSLFGVVALAVLGVLARLVLDDLDALAVLAFLVAMSSYHVQLSSLVLLIIN